MAAHPPKQQPLWRADLASAISLLLFGAAIYALDRVLRDYPLDQIVAALYAIPPYGIALSILTAALGYLALVGYDCVAFRFLQRPTKLRKMIIPSFITFAISNNAPASVVTAGGVRYRLYRAAGITPADAAAIAAFNVLTYTLGLILLTGIALLTGIESGLVRGIASYGRVLGAILVACVVVYMGVVHFGVRHLEFGRIHIRLPTEQLAWKQLGTSIADWLLSSGALYVLLHTLTPLPFPAFLATFLIAAFSSLLVPVPGGLGIFEAVVLLLRPSGVPAPRLLAALLLYRVIYYLLPLLLAGVLLGVSWLRGARAEGQIPDRIVDAMTKLGPRLVAWTTFLAGALLLISGAIPTSDRRLAWLGDILPLGIIEASHFLGSVTGAVLVVLAWGLERRARLAYELVRILFGFGILLTLLRSLDLRLACLLAVCWGIVLMAGRAFPQHVAPLAETMGQGWKFAIGALLVLEAWAAVLLYRHAEIGGIVWWRFALFSQAHRALRATLAGAIIILLFVLVRIFSKQARGRPG